MNVSALISQKNQLSAIDPNYVSRLYLEADALSPVEFPGIVSSLSLKGVSVYLALPRIMTPEAKRYLKNAADEIKKAGFKGFLIRSLESLGFLRECGISGDFVSDYGLYAFNSESRKVLYGFGFSAVTVPLELNSGEISSVGFSGDELVVYGRYPMMVTRNCIHNTLSGCDRKSTPQILCDRMKNEMPVENHCAYCLNIIHNGLPTNLILQKERILSLPVSSVRLEFTDETPQEVKRVISDFGSAFIDGKPAKTPETSYTNGHFKRGVD